MTDDAHQSELFRLIEAELRRRSRGDGVIVGVTGPDTSGKTRFSEGLAERLRGTGRRVELIHLDDFHNPRSLRAQGADELAAYFSNAFNLALVEAELLGPTSRGQLVDRTLTLLDLDSDSFSVERRYRIDGQTTVIVEGVLLFREPLDQYFDYRIYLQIGFDEVLRRAEARDVPRYGPAFLERYRSKYIPIQQRYLAEYSPQDRADLVVDNTDWRRPAILKAE